MNRVLSEDEIKELPRLEPQYGGCYVILDAERMLVSRKVPDFQLADGLKNKTPVTVDREVYEDCPRCRAERLTVMQAYPNLTRPRIVEKLRERKDRDTYFCNDCQGTGWIVEALDKLVKRLGIMTWADKAAALTTEELKAEMARSSDLNFRLRGIGFPPAVLTAEAARRL